MNVQNENIPLLIIKFPQINLGLGCRIQHSCMNSCSLDRQYVNILLSKSQNAELKITKVVIKGQFILHRNCVVLLHCNVLHRNCDLIDFNLKCGEAAVTCSRK